MMMMIHQNVCKDKIQSANIQLEDESTDESLHERQQHDMFMVTFATSWYCTRSFGSALWWHFICRTSRRQQSCEIINWNQQSKMFLTSEMLTNKDSLGSILNFDEGYEFLKPIRGTPACWQSVQKDLFVMVRQLGIPRWFCSFSSADLWWTELLQSIMKQEAQKCIDDLDLSDTLDMLKRNPVTAARMFDGSTVSYHVASSANW